MILLDIYIPSVDGSYDFMLDENVPVGQLIAEVSEMASKKVNGKPLEKREGFMMCSMEQCKTLDKNQTLYENGVRDGSRLMLV